MQDFSDQRLKDLEAHQQNQEAQAKQNFSDQSSKYLEAHQQNQEAQASTPTEAKQKKSVFSRVFGRRNDK